MTLEVAVEGGDDGKTVSSLDEDSGREVVVEPREPPALDAGGGVVVGGGSEKHRWMRADGGRVVVKVDDVDDVVGGGGGRGVVVMATDVLGVLLGLDLDETALAVWTAVLKKRVKRRWTLLLMLLMVVGSQDAPRR